MATTVLGLKTFTASDPVDYNEVNDNYVKIDNGVKTALQGRAAQNLLDNSWWRNPKEIINQRGETSKQGDWIYWIDRWMINAQNAPVELRDGGIYLPATVDANFRILQRIPVETIDNGKAYTLAICESNGTIRCVSGIYNNNRIGGDVIGDGSVYITLQPGVETYVYFIIDCYKNFTIRWAALYEGSYTADTLPAYQPKGYAAELAECQQRFHVYATENARPSDALDCCPPMILAPGQTVITQGTMTVDGKTLYYNSTDL